jgi:hypothetical protein
MIDASRRFIARRPACRSPRRTLLKAAAASSLVSASGPVASAAIQPSAASMVLAGVYDDRIDPAQVPRQREVRRRAVRSGTVGACSIEAGEPVAAPGWFVARLPSAEALDGELWFGTPAVRCALGRRPA